MSKRKQSAAAATPGLTPGRSRSKVKSQGPRVQRASHCHTEETLIVIKELARRLRVSQSVIVRSSLRLVGQATRVHNDPVLEGVSTQTLKAIRGAFNAAVVSEVSPGEAVREALSMFRVPTKSKEG